MGAVAIRRVAAALLIALLASGCSSANAAPAAERSSSDIAPASGTATAAAPSLARLVGQKLVVRMDGSVPTASLLGRIGRGEIGGVILFATNVTTRTALIRLTAQLQSAAKVGGQPPLLIAVDQEGGSIKRIPWAPPTLSAPQMGRLDSMSVARAQGARTGSALHALGINVDFAPVADVPATTASFMYREGRSWSFSAVQTAALSSAFASGLESTGVIPSMKHFPGLGLATQNTDASMVTIGVSTSRLAPGLRPYRAAIARHIPMIMLSNATYTAYDAGHAAGWSRAIIETLLRRDLGFTGVTITDSLTGTAAARGVTGRSLAVRAAIAGTDMLLLSGSEASTQAAYATLLADARIGIIARSRLLASYDRIVAMKAGL